MSLWADNKSKVAEEQLYEGIKMFQEELVNVLENVPYNVWEKVIDKYKHILIIVQPNKDD